MALTTMPTRALVSYRPQALSQTLIVTALKRIRRPTNPLLELRSPFELGLFVASNAVLRRAPRGSGHPVLVLPGFGAGDRSTAPLRTLLKQLGHEPYGWKMGRNLGPRLETVVGIANRLRILSDREESPIPIVGWSLGGVYARFLAQANPTLVSQVVTLGSPFNITAEEPTTVSPLWEQLHSRGEFVRDRDTIDLDAIPVPSTAIYSRTDGVVSWESCVQTVHATAENVAVRGSHVGLGVNIAAAMVIADRLAQPIGEWAPFEPSGTSKLLFPKGDE